MSKTNNLGTDPIGRLVLRLAIPSMLAQFVNVLYGIVDRMYIGNIPEIGDLALAGVGVCGPIVTLVSSFSFLIGIGGAPLIAMRLGEGNKKNAEEILANCFLLLTVMAVTLSVIFLSLKQPILMTFGASGDSFPYADEYITVYLIGAIFAILSVGLNQFITCQGFSTVAMFSVLIGAVLNIVLDPVFIFLFGMGVRGAALATLLSQMVSFLFVFTFLRGKRTHIRITFQGYSWKIMRRVLLFGFSPFIINASDSVIIIVLNTVLQRYGGPRMGDHYITCATIVLSCFQLITMPLAGITGGTQPILSFNYGAKNTARIREAFKKILMLCVAFVTVMLLISQLVPQLFVGIFSQDPDVMELSVWGIRVFTLAVIPMAFQYELVDGLTALGIAKVAITLSLNRKIMFMLFTVVLPIFLGATGAFYAEPLADAICGVVTTVVFLLLIGRLLRARDAMPDGQALYS